MTVPRAIFLLAALIGILAWFGVLVVHDPLIVILVLICLGLAW